MFCYKKLVPALYAGTDVIVSVAYFARPIAGSQLHFYNSLMPAAFRGRYRMLLSSR